MHSETLAKPSSVFLVEDHGGFRHQVAQLLADEVGLRVVGEAASAEDVLATLSEQLPSLLLVDIALPGMNGIQLVQRLRKRHNIACLILTDHDAPDYRILAERAGARGFVPKGNPEVLLEAVRQVLSGGDYWQPPPDSLN